MLRLFCSMTLLCGLAACSVVDLAAHGMKQYEKSKRPPEQQQEQPQPEQPAMAPPVMANDAAALEPPPAAVPSSPGAIKAQSLD